MSVADWVTILSIGVPIVGGQIVSIIVAVRTHNTAKLTHAEIQLPSNHHTIGHAAESVMTTAGAAAIDAAKVRAAVVGGPPVPPAVLDEGRTTPSTPTATEAPSGMVIPEQPAEGANRPTDQ